MAIKAKILIGGNEVLIRATEQLERCESFSLGMAWAQSGTDLEQALRKHKSKMQTAIIGTSGGFTDPEIIQGWNGDKLRVWLDEGGLFHPKLLLFIHQTHWSAILGSANATHQGLHREEEAGALLEGKFEGEGGNQLKVMEAAIQRWWQRANSVTPDVIKKIAELHSKRQQRKKPGEPKDDISPGAPLPDATWQEYLARVKSEPEGALGQRLRILNWSKSMQTKNFVDFSPNERRRYLGTSKSIGKSEGIDYRLFGSSFFLKGTLGKALGKYEVKGTSSERKLIG